MTASLMVMDFAIGFKTNQTPLLWTGNESKGLLPLRTQGLPLTILRAQVIRENFYFGCILLAKERFVSLI